MDLTQLLAENLFSFHAFMAGVTGKPIWGIEQREADDLGAAIQNVARHYDIPGVDQKTVDYIRLCRVLGMVYGMRIFASGMLSKRPVPATGASPKPDAPAPRVIVDNDKPQQQQQERTNGPRKVMASPGPGLPMVEVEIP